MEFAVIWVLFGIAAAMVATSKGLGGCSWFFIGVLFGPFGLIFAIFSNQTNPAKSQRKCPFCAEFIKNEAIVCKHCGRDLPVQETEDTSSPTSRVDISNWQKTEMIFAGKVIPTLSCPRCGTKHQEGATLCRACGWEPTSHP